MRAATWVYAGLLGVMLATACDDKNSTAPNNETPATAPNNGMPATAYDVSGAVSDTAAILAMSQDGKQNFVTVVRAAGRITAAVGRYRALLGEPNNLAALGDQKVGRREINWDGVPPGVTNVDNFPVDFFNKNSPRGLVYSTPGAGFRVSDKNFSDINQTYAQELSFFSQFKTFAPVGTNVTEAQFFLAGSTTPALTTGFGAVFSDVDRSRSAVIEYLDAQGQRLLVVAAPPAPGQGGLSFVGAVFKTPVVARVRIFSGTAPLGAGIDDVSSGGPADVVSLDDFLYGEPHPQS
jgi:hypothetical protein